MTASFERLYSAVLILLLSMSFTVLIPPSMQAFGQVSRNYSIYSDPVPDYAQAYATNALYDATIAWENANPGIKFFKADLPEKADLYVQWIRDTGTSNLGETIHGNVIEVALGDSHCNG